MNKIKKCCTKTKSLSLVEAHHGHCFALGVDVGRCDVTLASLLLLPQHAVCSQQAAQPGRDHLRADSCTDVSWRGAGYAKPSRRRAGYAEPSRCRHVAHDPAWQGL